MTQHITLANVFERHATKNKILVLVNMLSQISLVAGENQTITNSFAMRSEFKPASSCEGSLGSLILENISGMLFTQTLAEHLSLSPDTLQNSEIGISDITELTSTWLEERNEYNDEDKTAKKGKGSFARGEHKSSCNHFNQISSPEDTKLHSSEQNQLIQAITNLIQKYDSFTPASIMIA